MKSKKKTIRKWSKKKIDKQENKKDELQLTVLESL
jgi:hypothetical protein